MIGSRYVAAILVGTALGAFPVAAQCSGTTTCSTTNTASVTVGALVNLQMNSATTTLTPPGAADLAAGFVADAGPTFSVQANQDWTLSLKTSNPTYWTYVGTKVGVKAIGDLTWSVAVGGTFAAMTGADVPVAASAAATNGTAVAVFFRTTYAADYSVASNHPGVYSLPLVFTLSAP